MDMQNNKLKIIDYLLIQLEHNYFKRLSIKSIQNEVTSTQNLQNKQGPSTNILPFTSHAYINTNYNIHECNNTNNLMINNNEPNIKKEVEDDINEQLLQNVGEDLLIKNEEIDIKKEITETPDKNLEHSLVNKNIIELEHDYCKIIFNNVKRNHVIPTHNLQNEQIPSTDILPSPSQKSINKVAKMLQCELCDFKTAFRHGMKRHVTTKHNKLTRKVPSTDILPSTSHGFMNKKDKMLNCDFCKFKSASNKGMKIHITIKHNAQNKQEHGTDVSLSNESVTTNVHEYDNTNKTDNNETRVKEEEEIDENIDAQSENDSEFLVLEEESTDDEDINTEEEVTETDNEADCKHVCDKCSYKTNYRHCFVQHMDRSHNDESVTFSCDHCDYSTYSKFNLKSHLNYKHKSLYCCDNCNYTSGEKRNLTLHIDRKHNDKSVTYCCEHCEYTNHSEYALNFHIRMKHNKRKNKNDLSKQNNGSTIYSCNQCDYTGTSKFYVLKHRRKHKGAHNMINKPNKKVSQDKLLKALKCDYCDFKSFFSRGLKRHVTRKHNLQDKQDNLTSTAVKLEEVEGDINGQLFPNAVKDILLESNGIVVKEALDNTRYLDLNQDKINDEDNLNHTPDATKPYKCPNCDFSTKYREGLNRHMETIHNDGSVTYSCDYCDYKNISIYYLKHHVHLQHEGTIYACNKCDYKSGRKFDVQQHMTRRHNDGIVKVHCDKCTYTTSCHANLFQHVWSQHRKHTIRRCRKCDYKSGHAINLKKHMRFMHKEENYELFCYHCDYIGTSLKNIRMHKYRKHYPKVMPRKRKNVPSTHNLQVSKTDILTSTSRNNTNNAMTNYNETRVKKEINYDNEEQLHPNADVLVKNEELDIKDSNEILIVRRKGIKKRVITRRRPYRKRNPHPDPIGTVYKCHHCDFTTKSKHSLPAHIERRHTSDKSAYSCNECNYSTHTKSNLSVHKKAKHNPKEIHRCNSCDYTSTFKGSLRKHIDRKHNDSNVTYSCDKCKYTSGSKYNFLTHKLQKHTGTLRSCQKCDYKSADSSNFKHHMDRVHNHSVTYSCDHCDYTSHNKINLKQHDLKHHVSKKDVHRCHKCPKRFARKLELRKHINKKHGECSDSDTSSDSDSSSDVNTKTENKDASTKEKTLNNAS